MDAVMFRAWVGWQIDTVNDIRLSLARIKSVIEVMRNISIQLLGVQYDR